jgi:hypothetical protein
MRLPIGMAHRVMRAILSRGGGTPLPSLAREDLETLSGKHTTYMNSVSARTTQEIPI